MSTHEGQPYCAPTLNVHVSPVWQSAFTSQSPSPCGHFATGVQWSWSQFAIVVDGLLLLELLLEELLLETVFMDIVTFRNSVLLDEMYSE